ncbi:MAG: acetyl-CoA carboxylase, carboxyltransferase subunit beta [Holosporales bacterium]|jgi:acetyl-CoA carboxylase carboxyl transferase subunit beta|nr:acetyl-CoA carboxylase, carboxyltransferase subunit beta [Holosporales bacterium]
MSWLSEFVAPKIKAIIGSREQSDNVLWTKCPECERMVYTKELETNNMVCGYCDHHFPLPIDSRFKMLFDEGSFKEIATVHVQDDPIKFKDNKKYTDRLKEARRKTGMQDACVLANGTISSKSVVAFAMDFAFMGGSMGLSLGKSFVKATNVAIDSRSALISFTASGGARMQEGMFSLMQMASTVASICELKERRLPFINVFTHPTTGGVLASFAMLGDINIAEPRALIGFAGAGVIEKTIMQKLPEGFQKSEFLREHGMIDIISHRKDLNNTIRTLLLCLMK